MEVKLGNSGTGALRTVETMRGWPVRLHCRTGQPPTPEADLMDQQPQRNSHRTDLTALDRCHE